MTKTFTILHTNDIHSNLIGVGPALEYTPATLNDDGTIGGIERIATLIAERVQPGTSVTKLTGNMGDTYSR